jgi:tetratricopeptide (TPR) repeat protein
LQGLGRDTELSRRLGAFKVEGGTVQRQVFVDLFADLVRELRLGTPLFPLNKTIADTTAAIKLTPKKAELFMERGNAQFDKGEFDRAILDYSEALRLDFKGAEPFHNRGMALANKEGFDRAIADYTEALRLDPTRADTLHNRGLARAQQKSWSQAVADLTEALRIKPNNTAVLRDRAFIQVQRRDYGKAIADYEEVIRLEPASLRAGIDLARLLATCPEAAFRDGKKAVALATRACHATGFKNAVFLDTLAAAHAEAGQFDQALKFGQQALDLASDDLKAALKARIDRYRAGATAREPD